jgi:hypothetical protein
MEDEKMKKYEEPEMQIIIFESANIVTESNNLYTPGSNIGGAEGNLGWGDL